MEKKEIKEKIIESLNWRYATKIFDSSKNVSDDDVHIILEAARLAPSSYGIEMWKFIVVKNEAIREKLKEAGYNQPQISDSSLLIVVTQRTDAVLNLTNELIDRTSKIKKIDSEKLSGFKSMLENAVAQKLENGTLDSWIKSQAYIPLGIMIETAALLEIDTCPIEGFQPEKVDEVLGLKAKNLKSLALLAVGYRGNDPMSSDPKVRRNFEEVVEFI
ncbi:MAG TPA: NAD(P)H-dependent oxidoreductase [Candidatus Paceibacterota bacterium]